jgi:threonine/homoserine/homoserine lactone efflux protein
MIIDIFFQILPSTTFIIATGITPGPNNIMLTTSAAANGLKKTLPLLFGIALGFLIFLLLTTFGLNILFDKYPEAYRILKVVGTIYLLYLSYGIVKSAHSNQKVTILNFFSVIFFQFINPKVWGMSMTAIGTFSLSGENYLTSAILISIWFIVLYLPCGLIWVLFGSTLKDYILDNSTNNKIFNYSMAFVLSVTAVYIFLDS